MCKRSIIPNLKLQLFVDFAKRKVTMKVLVGKKDPRVRVNAPKGEALKAALLLISQPNTKGKVTEV